MRRFLACLLALYLLLPALPARAEDPPISEAETLRGAVLTELSTGTRLWGKEAEQRQNVAGLVKLPAILTLAQSFDDGSLIETTDMRVSERASGIPGPTAFLAAGEQLPARELMKAAVMISAGDAIWALGENAYGSESVFTENINATLKNLGLSVTVTDPLGTGLQLSPAELAQLGAACAQSVTFTKYCMLFLDAVNHPDGRETELVNANRLIKNYAGCKGLLTGSSAADGYCGVFAAVRGGATLIAVVVGAENAVKRTAAGSALLDFGFANYRFERVCKAGEPVLADVPVRDGDVRTVNLIAREDVTVVLPAGKGKLTVKLDAPAYLEAPLSADVPALEAAYVDENGGKVAAVPLYPERDVLAYGLTDILKRILSLFIA